MAIIGRGAVVLLLLQLIASPIVGVIFPSGISSRGPFVVLRQPIGMPADVEMDEPDAEHLLAESASEIGTEPKASLVGAMVEEAPHDFSRDDDRSLAAQVTDTRLLQEGIRINRPPEANATHHVHHEVEHVELLNNSAFWWLMGVGILLMAAVVIRVEVHQSNLPPKERQVSDGPDAAAGGVTPLSDGPDAAAGGGVPRSDPDDLSQYTRAWWLHLGSCVVAINLAMLLWGIAQEFVMTNDYKDRWTGQSSKIPGVLFIVLVNRLVSVLFSMVVLLARGSPLYSDTWSDCFAPAATNICAAFCQYKSLDFISFGLQTSCKSAKLLPVLFISSWRGKRHTFIDYAEVSLIVASLLIFGYETDGRENSSGFVTVLGIALLFGLICFDSMTPHFQDIMFQRSPGLDSVQANFMLSSIASVIILAITIVSHEVFTCMHFVVSHPQSALHLMVLSLASTLTQYLILYTVKHFGPVTFTLIASTRQVISVCISDILFEHELTNIAIVAVVIITGTVIIRAVRPFAAQTERVARAPLTPSFLRIESFLNTVSRFGPLWVCVLSIQVFYGFYAIDQEFLSVHTFTKLIFEFPLVLVALNHTMGALFALGTLWAQDLPTIIPNLYMTLLPAAPNLAATTLQHAALYSMLFPAHTLMKALKPFPVMVIGSFLKNRAYGALDYLEALLLTGLVAYFVWDFQVNPDLIAAGAAASSLPPSFWGIIQMLGYVIIDSFTCNFEDYVYQTIPIDPGQMLFGMEAASASVAWVILLVDGSLVKAIDFMIMDPSVIQYVFMLGLAAAAGAYACTLTVRVYGPAVFTLIMVSRQVMSLFFSVIFFRHDISGTHLLCLIVVALLMLTASVRRVSVQLDDKGDHNKKEDAVAH